MRKLSLFFWQVLAACLVAMLIAQHISINILNRRLTEIAEIAKAQDGWVYFNQVKDKEWKKYY
jgi:hypothetical protein